MANSETLVTKKLKSIAKSHNFFEKNHQNLFTPPFYVTPEPQHISSKRKEKEKNQRSKISRISDTVTILSHLFLPLPELPKFQSYKFL